MSRNHTNTGFIQMMNDDGWNVMAKKRMSLLMFSGNYDKAMAGLILANSAREIDVEVTMFFAFWSLFLVRDPEKMTLEDKTLYEKLMT